MSLSKKLQVPTGKRLLVLNMPKGLKLDAKLTTEEGADAIMVFVHNSTELRSVARPVLAAAREDKIAWIAYPKAGQLNTDLNRDRLWKMTESEGVRPVRQISIDQVWSALRFRPA